MTIREPLEEIVSLKERKDQRWAAEEEKAELLRKRQEAADEKRREREAEKLAKELAEKEAAGEAQ